MKDKEKQIEEMAKVLSTVKRCDTLAVSECIKKKCEYPHYEGVTCIAEHQAERLFEQGYRKLPKDSVVLTKECVSDKWIDLLTEFDEMGFEPTTLPPSDMSVEEYTAFYKDKLLMCLARERKETASEILQWFKDHYDGIGWCLIETYFKEQFDVEIKG